MPIQHKRMAFKYAFAFVTDEIYAIEESLVRSHMSEHVQVVLKKRLKELKSDLETLEQYDLHH